MKKILTLFAAAFLGLNLSAQVFTDASAFPVYGKASDATKTRYQRLPAALEGVSRGPVWYLGTQSAGLYVRFRSNSTAIHARWTSTYGSWLSNMNPTGVRGLDLYILVDGVWRPAGVGRPSQEKTSTDCLVKNMTPEWREYMLYLSLYDGVDSLEIGVDEGASLEQPVARTPRTDRPVVMYGTSILQGCSASRPGMAHTNMIARALDREVINLGFSGNALLDPEIARLMASVPDPSVYVLDYAPNAYAPMIKEHGEEFFRILRDAHPDVPVIFIEDVIFPHTLFDSAIRKEVEDKNFEQKALFERLKSQGEKLIFYIPAWAMTMPDGETTADTIHLTDLGMQRYVDLVLPVIREALRLSGQVPAPEQAIGVFDSGTGGGKAAGAGRLRKRDRRRAGGRRAGSRQGKIPVPRRPGQYALRHLRCGRQGGLPAAAGGRRRRFPDGRPVQPGCRREGSLRLEGPLQDPRHWLQHGDGTA